MAAGFLNRSHALVWLPPRGIGERAFATEARLLLVQPAAKGGAASLPLQYRKASLDALPKVKSVSLVYDARDVTVLTAQLPALPAARLAKAVPNVVEDQLLQDVGSCAFAIGPPQSGNQRTVAVVDRSWLEFTLGAFERRGITVAAAWPAQLVLPRAADGWAMACLNDGIAVRMNDQAGFGWAASPDADARAEAIAQSMLLAREKGVGAGELVIYAEDGAWRAPAERAGQQLGQGFRMTALPLPKDCSVDLLDGRGGSARQRWLARVDWRAWRWPVGLAAGTLALWLLGLNLQWGQMVRERKALQVAMDNRFRQTVPNAQVVDSMLQMQRHVASLRARTGQTGPDDFVPLLARFASALGARAADSLAGVDYRDGRLKVRFQAVFVQSGSVRDSLRDACRRQGLVLRFDGESEPTATVSISS